MSPQKDTERDAKRARLESQKENFHSGLLEDSTIEKFTLLFKPRNHTSTKRIFIKSFKQVIWPTWMVYLLMNSKS
ncbi:unnamed protein product [Cunninghamella echinulata]